MLTRSGLLAATWRADARPVDAVGGNVQRARHLTQGRTVGLGLPFHFAANSTILLIASARDDRRGWIALSAHLGRSAAKRIRFARFETYADPHND
jgi:hypothetical protein